MKRLTTLALTLHILMIASAVFAAPANNIATSDNGVLQFDLNALKQGAVDGTVLPIMVNERLQILVPTVSTPDGIALANALMNTFRGRAC